VVDSSDPQMIKADLLAAMQAGRDDWDNLISRIDKKRMTEPGVEGEWSVKDLIAHISTYEGWMAQLLNAGGPNIPHVTDSMTQDQTNTWVFEQNRHRSTDDVLAGSHESFRQLVQAVLVLSPRDLASPTKFEWARGKPAYRLIPYESHEHYRHHVQSIAGWLARQSANNNQPEAEG
jgi:hypothetical protein